MILFLLLIPLLTLAQDLSNKTFTIGTRNSYFTDSEGWDNTFLYYIPEYSDEKFGEEVGLKRSFKLRIFDYVSSDEKVIVDPLDISIEFFSNNNSFQIGFLRYRFSETFGLQLLDVANPRDYSEFVFNDLSWSKRSVFGMNDTYKWNNFQIQLILTLWPNGDRLPYKDSPFDPTGGQTNYEGGVVEHSWFKDLEYGSRIKYLLQNGLDLSFLYYHHFSRPTFQDVTLSFTGVSVKPTDHMVDSFGSSASYVLNNWVIRADALYTLNDLIQKDLLTYKKENHFQTLIGIDRSFDNFLLGIQTQSDTTANRHFFSFRTEYTRFEWWKPSFMIFKNYRRDDQWMQLRSAFEYESIKLSLSYDNIHGAKSDSDLFGFFRKQDRILVDASYTY